MRPTQGVVAVVKTGVEEWKPRLAEHTCRCRDNRYHLRRWIRVDGFWEYHYVCHLVRATSPPLQNTLVARYSSSTASATDK